MRAILVDDKGFKKNMSIEEFRPTIFIAVQVYNVVNNYMYCDEGMEHFDKTNFYSVGFRFSGKTPKGTPIYKQYESIYKPAPQPNKG